MNKLTLTAGILAVSSGILMAEVNVSVNQPTTTEQSTAVAQEKKETAPSAPKMETAKKPGCSLCNLEFKTAKEAQRHFKKAHGKGQYCDKCNLAWSTKKEKMDHAREMHPKFECCGQKFANDKEHDQHMKEHRGGGR